MRFSFPVLAAAILPVALGATFNVTIGAGGQLRYSPETVTAAAGDIVNFIFHPSSHSATQSTFNQPCVPLASGFSSGFMPVASETGVLPMFQVTVNDTTPIWVHCEQTGHCRSGMVFAINPPASPDPESFSAFQALAMSGQTASATSPGSSSTTSGSSSTTSTGYPQKTASGASKQSATEILGGLVGAMLVAAVL
ncbi:hypothetical protein JAAARDRAFT_55712 [Jaapia argillacea MUCL 33604]|uniref:Phytocyanin domain-containing protein n=1 Tax=Jaapia argillacea MUCL 33604 TaxID=933084 RepID=A0A067QEG4_9AGAM|nr:hypothetical protein JAAARDRAFT_55712 [Jaapia argillacea MUCL 33604]